MNYFPPTELLGACIKAGTKIELPDSLGACAGGSGELGVILGAGVAGLLAVVLTASVFCYACFRIIPQYQVRGKEWARKEAMDAGMRFLALLLVLFFVGVYLTA